MKDSKRILVISVLVLIFVQVVNWFTIDGWPSVLYAIALLVLSLIPVKISVEIIKTSLAIEIGNILFKMLDFEDFDPFFKILEDIQESDESLREKKVALMELKMDIKTSTRGKESERLIIVNELDILINEL